MTKIIPVLRVFARAFGRKAQGRRIRNRPLMGWLRLLTCKTAAGQETVPGHFLLLITHALRWIFQQGNSIYFLVKRIVAAPPAKCSEFSFFGAEFLF